MRSQLLPLLVLGITVSVGNALANNEKVLHSFSGGTDGSYPVAAMIADRAGNLYGTARYGGANGQGTVFELTNSGGTWNETILYSFAGGNDGASPSGTLVFDTAGNLYGTTRLGGPDNSGTVFKLSKINGTWEESVLYSFTGGNDGGSPQAALTIDGNALIGTAPGGGAYGNGVVFGAIEQHLSGLPTEARRLSRG